MRLTMPTKVVFAVCLAAAPCLAFAQTSSPIPMQSAQSAPVSATVSEQPLAWSALAADQQRMLAPLQGQWSQLPPARQRRLAEHARHWATLPPEHQQQIRERLHRWAMMTPEQRRQLHQNTRAFHDLTPAERARVSEAFRKFQSLPPAERRALRERWRTMTPEQRHRWATEHAGKPIPMHPPAHQEH